MAETYRYAAFVSYSSKDAAFAKRLHRALEGYGIPSTLGRFDTLGGGGKPNRVYPVFRDREEMAAGDLGQRITTALRESRSLIVVCSPNAAASPWVEKEIEAFLALGRRDRVFAIIAPTAPLVDENGADATARSFPPALRGDVMADPEVLEPVAADARAAKDGFRNAWLKLVAGIIGVNAGALRDRDRRRRRANQARVAAAILLVGAAVAVSWLTQDRWGRAIADYLRFGRFVVAPGDVPAAGSRDGGFQDCAPGATDCPEMAVLPAGRFLMGSPQGEPGRAENEGPQHAVAVGRFAVSKYDVTFANWQACVAGGGCQENVNPSRHGFSGDARPVINVSWDDAQQYARWLSRETGQTYRMLSEAEWEYAARGVTDTGVAYKVYPWGDDIGAGNANCNGCASRAGDRQTSPVGSFKPNAFGLYDMVGNVFQWVQDCYHSTYEGAPATGYPAWAGGDCSQRVLRGGSYASPPGFIRPALRFRTNPASRQDFLGFRVARTLAPL
jgi:formylglycine-generating enzyme required for sulfatase activity